jgi:hypothetical protein
MFEIQRYLCDVIKTFHFPVFKKKKKRSEKKRKKENYKNEKKKKKKKYGKEVRGKDSDREKSPTSGCACVYPREHLRGHVTSCRPLGHAQWYYYYSSSTKCTGCACARDHFR